MVDPGSTAGPTENQPVPPQAPPAEAQPEAQPQSVPRQAPPPAAPPRPGPPPGWPAPPHGWQVARPGWQGPPPGLPPRPLMPPWPVAPPRPSLMSRRWPGPASRAAAPVIILGTAGAAAIAAASIPLTRPGLGWLIAGISATAILTTAAWSNSRSRNTEASERKSRGDSLATGAWAAATVALLGVGTLRAAGWLFVLCLLTAVVTGCLAVSPGRSVAGLLSSLLLPPVAAIRSVPWAARGLSRIGQGRSGSPGRILATVGVSLGLLVVFGALFASADVAFAKMLGWLVPDIGPVTVFRAVILFPLLVLGLAGGAFLLAAPPDLTGLEAPARRRVRRLEWAIPLAVLDVLFTAFVLVQITVLFGGAAHVLSESGPTFAEYARRGFWQLLLVTALTLLVLAAAARWAPRDTRADRILIRVLLGALALLTLVIVASALYRMHVYQQAYGFTRLRVFISAFELWLGLVFILVLGAGLRLRAAWLPRLVVGSAVLCLLTLAALNPDRFIADQNVDRHETIGRIDVVYLSQLSADAAPALDRLSGQLRDCALHNIAEKVTEAPDNWRGWNLARAQARDLVADDPPQQQPFAECRRISQRHSR
ncbi:MAG TPA: DUF4173 domain-containing protein [Micromonospora sp.]|nr:DUF4173 domain-containing protein [Micromonospora sp.]